MRKKGLISLAAAISAFAFSFQVFSQSQRISINEFVTDPKVDRNDDGLITPSDEGFEFYNSGNLSVNVDNWVFYLIDTTPQTKVLHGFIPPSGFYFLSNPVGAQNDNGRLELYDDIGNLIDSISYGSWPDASISSGNSTNVSDESWSRKDDGGTIWTKTFSTLGYSNGSSNSSPTLYWDKRDDLISIYSKNVPSKGSILQSSKDLVTWDKIKTNNGITSLYYSSPPTNSQQFFRIIR